MEKGQWNLKTSQARKKMKITDLSQKFWLEESQGELDDQGH